MPERSYILPLVSHQHRERFLNALSLLEGFICFGNPLMETLDTDSDHGSHWFSALPAKRIGFESENLEHTVRQLIDESAALLPGERIGGMFHYEAGYILESAFHQTSRCGGPAPIQAAIYHWHIRQESDTSLAMICSERCSENVLTDIQRILAETSKPGWQGSGQRFSLTKFSQEELQQRFENKVERILDYILAGDCYQVNLSQRFQANFKGNPWEAYTHLTDRFPTSHAAYLALGEEKVLSISPESFLEIRNRQVITRPIKGTRPRGNTPDRDQQLASELQNSPKDRAENIMIVDLLRNDLGRFCIPGSISATKLLELESYRNVHHLVSTVSGKLRTDIHPIQALALAFPGGSITGAPKIRAMEIIHELEAVPRGPYCGSVFSIDHHGSLYSNIAIRTLYARGDALYCHGGGGIVADSDPAGEFQETLDKVGPLMGELSRSFGEQEK